MYYADWTDLSNREDTDNLIARVRDNEGRDMVQPSRDKVIAVAVFPRNEAIALIRSGQDVDAIVANAYWTC